MKLHDLHRPSLRFRLYLAVALLVGVLACLDAYSIRQRNWELLRTNTELAGIARELTHTINIKLAHMENVLGILRNSDVILSEALTGGADVDEVLRRVVE